MMKANNLCVLGVLAVMLGAVAAITEEEKSSLIEVMKPIMDDCGQQHGVTKEQVLAAKAAGDVDAIEPCFYACVFKKIKYIDDSGLFDINATLERVKKYIKSEDDIKKITEIVTTCTSVNEEAVTDAEQGCERSKLLVSCLLKEKANFTPFSSA